MTFRPAVDAEAFLALERQESAPQRELVEHPSKTAFAAYAKYLGAEIRNLTQAVPAERAKFRLFSSMLACVGVCRCAGKVRKMDRPSSPQGHVALPLHYRWAAR